MTPRSRAALRGCGALLLALAVSPVTAPFSTCDLAAPLGGPVAQACVSQKPCDDPVPLSGGTALRRLTLEGPGRQASEFQPPVQARPVLHAPLRI